MFLVRRPDILRDIWAIIDRVGLRQKSFTDTECSSLYISNRVLSTHYRDPDSITLGENYEREIIRDLFVAQRFSPPSVSLHAAKCHPKIITPKIRTIVRQEGYLVRLNFLNNATCRMCNVCAMFRIVFCDWCNVYIYSGTIAVTFVLHRARAFEFNECSIWYRLASRVTTGYNSRCVMFLNRKIYFRQWRQERQRALVCIATCL